MQDDVERIVRGLSDAHRAMLTDPQYPPLSLNQRLVAAEHGWLRRCGCCLNDEMLSVRSALLSSTQGE